MKGFNILIKSVLVLLIVVSFVQLVNSADKLTEMLDVYAELRKKVDEMQQTVEQMENELDREVDKDYIVEIAREHGYRFPGEIIINNDLPK